MYRAESPLSNRHALASALQHSLAAGPLVIRWTVTKAERLSRERKVGVECAEAASGAVRPLTSLAESSSNVAKSDRIEALWKGPG